MNQPNPITDAIKAMYAAMPGSACEYCDADSELVEPHPNVVILEIRHDDDCPVLASHQED